jgi:cytochrome P450
MSQQVRTGCPVVEYNPFLVEPAVGHADAVDVLREQYPHFRAAMTPGFFVYTRLEAIRDALQRADLFSSRSVTPLDPNPSYLWIPEMLDPPEHTKWRQLLAPHFSPGAMAKMEDPVRQRCIEVLEPLLDKGRCDFMADFAWRYPTTIFMELFGLPVEDADLFLAWEAAILHTPADKDPDRSKAVEAMTAVQGYFAQLIKERAEEPRDDLLSEALTWKIDGEPIRHDDLLAFCLLMFMAGLDTVSTQLAYSFFHLATHPADRGRIVADPAVIPNAVEELLRYYAFVAPGRTVTVDTEFHGLELKKGEMVYLPLCGANRDPAGFEHADVVDFNRQANAHIAFGAGPHRCLGSHLARRELRIALEEWHARIPEYRLAEGVEVVEHGGMFGIDVLSLTWD